MMPSYPFLNISNCMRANTIDFGYGVAGFPLFNHGIDGRYIVRRKFGRRTALHSLITHVVSMITNGEVFRVYAPRVIARMKNIITIGYLSNHHFKNKPMYEGQFALDANTTVTTFNSFFTSPFNTIANRFRAFAYSSKNHLKIVAALCAVPFLNHGHSPLSKYTSNNQERK